jgi:hypothetical protein
MFLQDIKDNPGTKQGDTRKRMRKGGNYIADLFKIALNNDDIILKGPKQKPEGYFFNHDKERNI